MFNLVILIVVDITSQVLFNSLIEIFYLFIGLEIKGYKKLVIHSEFRGKYYKKPKGKNHTSVYYKLV